MMDRLTPTHARGASPARSACSPLLLLIGLLCAAPAAAQERAQPDMSEAARVQRAASAAQEAEAMEGRGQWEEAARMWERAYFEHAQPRYIWRRVLNYEQQRKHSAALSLLESSRAELASDPSITDVVLVEERLREAIRASRPAAPHAAAEEGGSSAAGWIMVGSGGALLITGGLSLWAAGEVRADALCASNVSAPSGTSPDCAGRDRAPITSSQLEDARSDESLFSALGVGGLAVGAVLVGLGVYWLVSEDASRQDDAHTALRWWASPTPDGAAAGLQWRF